jgi:hypothetical protein
MKSIKSREWQQGCEKQQNQQPTKILKPPLNSIHSIFADNLNARAIS